MRITCILKLADSAGDLTLNSTDPSDPPQLQYRYFETEWDRKRMREAVHLSLRLLEHQSFGALVERRISPTDYDVATDGTLDTWLRQNVATTQHTSGTCKMGQDDFHLRVANGNRIEMTRKGACQWSLGNKSCAGVQQHRQGMFTCITP